MLFTKKILFKTNANYGVNKPGRYQDGLAITLLCWLILNMYLPLSLVTSGLLACVLHFFTKSQHPLTGLAKLLLYSSILKLCFPISFMMSALITCSIHFALLQMITTTNKITWQDKLKLSLETILEGWRYLHPIRDADYAIKYVEYSKKYSDALSYLFFSSPILRKSESFMGYVGKKSNFDFLHKEAEMSAFLKTQADRHSVFTRPVILALIDCLSARSGQVSFYAVSIM